MDASSPRRRVKCHPDATLQSPCTQGPSSSSHWIQSIQNQSFQPKPTAYSPYSFEDEDPLMLQQRQCCEKIQALRQVRERIQFYPVLDAQEARTKSTRYSMNIATTMILAKEPVDWQNDGHFFKNARQRIGIEALGSLEMLLFGFFSRHELVRVSGVCTAWKALARDDLFWEPLLFTSLEKYPMRSLLGLEKDRTGQDDVVPAILVYMVYQRLKIAQAACPADTSHKTGTTGNGAATRRNATSRELLSTQRQAGAILQTTKICRDEAGASVHLVCMKMNSTTSTQEIQQDQEGAQVATELDPQAQGDDQGALMAAVVNGAIVVFGDQEPVAMNAQNGAGVTVDEDEYRAADGQDWATLSTWLSTKKRVNERTLRSFLRQLLLAVDTLEWSSCEHADISPVNIVVHCQPRKKRISSQNGLTAADLQVEREESDEEYEGNHASVDISAVRGSGAKVLQDNRKGGTRLDPVLVMDAERNIHGLNGEDLREIARQRQILAGAEPEVAAGAGVFANGGNRGAMAAAFHNRVVFPHPSMVTSVIQTAMTVWARGRYADANANASLLTQLLHFPDSFSSSLRSFLEFAQYLIITHSATASRLLRHDYLQCPENRLDYLAPHWSRTPTRDANEYKSKLVAYYGSLPSCVEGLLDENFGTSVSPTVMDELMPRTNLGSQYFFKSLEEANLSGKRFVSVVAPPTASSSWVRKLACTQTYTLQRLDLSHARVPMSVLLQELATLPRLTHLRLPKQILRDENLEHLVAALAYSDLLPSLQGLDTIVRQAMDRMEKSYLLQLDMVTFLLRKPSMSNPAAAMHSNLSSLRDSTS